MIKTALKTTAVAATLTGATFLAAAPALATGGPHNHNHGTANGNTINVTIVGGYGVTCGSVSLSSQSATGCNGNDVTNDGNSSANGTNSGYGNG